MTDRPQRVERAVVYEEVWTSPVRTVAARYGVSDVALAKVCRRLGVPLPPRGYWAKRAAGAAVPPRPPLPARAAGDADAVELAAAPVAAAVPPADAPDAASLIARERDPAHRIVVPAVLRRPHRLVAEYEAAFGETPVAIDGPLLRAQGRVLAITVSRDALPRALRVMDALIRALEARGHAVEVTDPRDPPCDAWGRPRSGWPHTRARILEEWAYFDLREGFRLEKPPPATKRGPRATENLRASLGLQTKVATGQLRLRTLDPDYSTQHHAWQDTPSRLLEESLNDFVVGLIRAVVRTRERRADMAATEATRASAAARAEELRHRQHEEGLRIGDLRSRIDDWQLAQQIRAFVTRVIQDAATRGETIEPEAGLARWIAWARGHADRVEAEALQSVTRPRESQT